MNLLVEPLVMQDISHRHVVRLGVELHAFVMEHIHTSSGSIEAVAVSGQVGTPWRSVCWIA